MAAADWHQVAKEASAPAINLHELCVRAPHPNESSHPIKFLQCEQQQPHNNNNYSNMNHSSRNQSEGAGDGTGNNCLTASRVSGLCFVQDRPNHPMVPVECRLPSEMNGDDDNTSDQSSSSSGHGASSSSMLRAARADVLSSSLVETMLEAGRQYGAQRKVMERSAMVHQSSGSSSDSAARREECLGNLSNDSSGHASSTGPAVVTGGTSTTSSEEYRYSLSGSVNSSNRSKQSLENRLSSRHHHHSSRQSDQPHRLRSNYGASLPEPMDVDKSRHVTSSEHAAVIARLPPPKTFSSGSSFQSSSSERGNDEHANLHRGTSPLVAPHREPGLHTIRRTLKNLSPMDDDDDEEDEPSTKKRAAHRSSKKQPAKDSHKLDPVAQMKAALASAAIASWRHSTNNGSDDESGQDVNAGSGGSGTEGGYAGSASSNEQMAQGSCSSPSVSSEDSQDQCQKKSTDCFGRKFDSASANIADFSSGDSESLTFASRFASCPSSSPSSPSVSSDEQEATCARSNAKATRKRRRSEPWTNHSRHHERQAVAVTETLRLKSDMTWNSHQGKSSQKRLEVHPQYYLSSPKKESSTYRPPILMVGSDIMAHVLTFLEPPEIYDVLTMPLSKDWRDTFSLSEELWRVLCLLDPFKARVDKDGNMSDDSFNSDLDDDAAFNRHRMMYASFVRCMKYLARIKDDAIHGRPPSVRYSSGRGNSRQHNIGENQSLKNFLANARNIVGRSREEGEDSSASSNNSLELSSRRMHDAPIGVSDDGSSIESKQKSASGRKRKTYRKKTTEKKVKYGFSSLTSRLLGPAATGEAGINVELPWSCAIYSIVNWMVAFGDVEGIQVMCLKVLPFLLEDEQQRITAQRAGLTDIVLRDMVLFPESSQLNTAAFHTIVLLARPLGGREGMLFHSSMVNSSGIFNSGSQSGKNGIAVMLDSMRRFEGDDVLQAMACWALVNVALAPSQKAMLVKLGGIESTANAMVQHPYSAEVQFRALFALINLVIPSVNLPDAAEERRLQEQLGEVNDTSEKEMLDDSVAQITNLVVVAMKNFCSSEAILNRACLVLHNLSLTQDYHTTLLWTPNCYQMLEWCLANYRTDQVLQQSAAGTLHRLQVTLSQDENLRTRFMTAIQAQQQQSLEQARHEARLLHEQQQMLLQRGTQNRV